MGVKRVEGLLAVRALLEVLSVRRININWDDNRKRYTYTYVLMVPLVEEHGQVVRVED